MTKYTVTLTHWYKTKPDESPVVEMKDGILKFGIVRDYVIDAETENDASYKAQQLSKLSSKNFIVEIETIEKRQSESG